MGPFKAEVSWNEPSGAVPSAHPEIVRHEQSHTGWWLLPSMIAGALFWVWAASKIF